MIGWGLLAVAMAAPHPAPNRSLLPNLTTEIINTGTWPPNQLSRRTIYCSIGRLCHVPCVIWRPIHHYEVLLSYPPCSTYFIFFASSRPGTTTVGF